MTAYRCCRHCSNPCAQAHSEPCNQDGCTGNERQQLPSRATVGNVAPVEQPPVEVCVYCKHTLSTARALEPVPDAEGWQCRSLAACSRRRSSVRHA